MSGRLVMNTPVHSRRVLPAPKKAMLAIATACVAVLAGAYLPWPHAIAVIALATAIASIFGVASGLIPCNLG